MSHYATRQPQNAAGAAEQQKKKKKRMQHKQKKKRVMQQKQEQQSWSRWHMDDHLTEDAVRICAVLADPVQLERRLPVLQCQARGDDGRDGGGGAGG